MQESDAVSSLTALAQPMRLRMFRALVVAGAEGITPGVLAEKLEVPAATLSFHLKELLHADLVSQERASRNLIYRANFDQMNALLAFLLGAVQPATGPYRRRLCQMDAGRPSGELRDLHAW